MPTDPIAVFEDCDTSIVSDTLDEHGTDGL